MILHIPHSSHTIPDTKLLVDELAMTIQTDWYTDELFTHEHSTRHQFEFSRFYCDVERYYDEKEDMYKKGMGIVYTQDIFGNTVRDDKVSEFLATKSRIISDIYIPHHQSLLSSIHMSLCYFDVVCIVDCHSFYSEESPIDFCIGVTEYNTPKELVSEISELIISNGYSVGVNEPYSGSILPEEFSGDKRVKSIMIELNKRTYLKNRGNSREKDNDNFLKVNSLIQLVLCVIDKYERGYYGDI